MEILPAILAHDAHECREHLTFPRLKDEAPAFHIDVLDGSMFGTSCFSDPKEIGSWGTLPPIELHLMVQNPLPHIEAWKKAVPSLQRVIVHAEIARPLGPILERINALDLDNAIAINPETPPDVIRDYVEFLESLLVMGIHPGKSGQAFLGEAILAKVKRAAKLYPELYIAVDGGVTIDNAHALINAGASRLVASSAIWRAPDPLASYHQLAMTDVAFHE